MLYLIIAILKDGKNILRNYKLEVLKSLCNDFCLSTTGKKSVLINSIWEYVNSVKIPVEHCYLNGEKSICEYIMKYGIHTAIAKHIIYKIASIPEELKNDSMSSCLNIVKSGFNDSIFDDIQSELMMYFLQCIRNNCLYIQNGRIAFCNPSFESDITLYNGCYKILYRTLKKYSLDYRQMQKYYGEDFITVYNEDNEERELNVKSTKYMNVLSDICGLYDCEHSEDLKKFFIWIKNHYGEKRALTIVHIIVGRLDGLKKYEICQKYDINERTFQRYSTLIKIIYGDYSKECDDFKFVKPSLSGTFGGYVKNAITDSGFSYGDIFDSELNKPIVINPNYSPLKKSRTMLEEFINSRDYKESQKYFLEMVDNPYSAFYKDYSVLDDNTYNEYLKRTIN